VGRKDHLAPKRALEEGCRYYLDRPDLPIDPKFTRALMRWFLAMVPRGRLTGPEIARMVDDAAFWTESVTDARRRVAEALGHELESVVRNHQRHGKNVEELNRQRAEFLADVEARRATQEQTD
jgi:hypothetical protein